MELITQLGLEQFIRRNPCMWRAVILTTISGLLPTAYGIGGTDAMLVPMTMAMAWGLTSGTILTLVWVPCAYAILEDWNKFLGRTKFLKFFAEENTHPIDSQLLEGH